MTTNEFCEKMNDLLLQGWSYTIGGFPRSVDIRGSHYERHQITIYTKRYHELMKDDKTLSSARYHEITSSGDTLQIAMARAMEEVASYITRQSE